MPEFRVTRAGRPHGAPAIGPLASDEIAIPAQNGLRSGQQDRPGRSGQDSAGIGEDEAVARLPARSAELPLEDAELMPECEHLSTELGVGALVDEAEVGEEAGKRVGEADEHGGQS